MNVELVNEAVDLLNQLSAVMDETKGGKNHGGVIAMEVGFDGAGILMQRQFFLETTKPKYYDVEFKGSEFDRPYRVKNELDGVTLMAVFSAGEILSLKETHPAHFNYITREVQL